MGDIDRERLLLGIDIGGTKTVVAVARANGEILAESRLEDWTSGEWQKDITTLASHARMLLRGSRLLEEDIHAVGLSVPGPLDIGTGHVIDAPNLPGWKSVPLVENMWREFGVQCLLENDANAAALAEWRYGVGADAPTRNLIYLTMSTGLGAGMILDGRLYRGGRFQAGEVGHIPVVAQGGRLCACGLSGCLEAYVGGAALAQTMREDIEGGEQTLILELAEGRPERISAKLWVAAIREQDDYALRLRRTFLGHLTQGLAILVTAFDPDSIVLGTIIQQNEDLFLEELVDRVRASTWPSLHHVRIEAGKLGSRLPAYAALSVAALEPDDLSPGRDEPSA